MTSTTNAPARPTNQWMIMVLDNLRSLLHSPMTNTSTKASETASAEIDPVADLIATIDNGYANPETGDVVTLSKPVARVLKERIKGGDWC